MIDYSLHPVLIEVLWILNIQFSKEACPPYYFMYRKEVIRKVGQYGFTPLLSTKIPLKEDDIYFLKESGIKFLQFSLDSIFPSTLQTMVRVKEDYIDNVKQMFEYS